MPPTMPLAILFLAGLITGGTVTQADTLHLVGGAREVGRVVSFDRQNAAFRNGCGADPRLVSWNAIERLEFDGGCDGGPDGTLVAHGNRCAADNFRTFVVRFKDDATPVIAESAAITKDGLIHLDLFEPWDQAHGGISHVRQIEHVTVCRDDIRRPAVVPRSFCREPRQIAVAFDYRTPLSNRILTNGFSFFIRVSGQKPDSFDLDDFRKEVKSVFQYGVSLWTTALQDRKHLLTEPIRAFVESRTSRSSSGYTLLTPPQVIELMCPQAATFVVDLSFGNRGLFPRPPLVLAKAQTEGRTIALNVLDIGCYRTLFRFDEKKVLPFELPGGCLNLVPIMAHELGHAFGIRHIDDPARHALMDSRFSYDALVPTDRDVIEFVRVLSSAIEGSAPGEITMVSSDGVQPPADFVPCAEQGSDSGTQKCK